MDPDQGAGQGVHGCDRTCPRNGGYLSRPNQSKFFPNGRWYQLNALWIFRSAGNRSITMPN